MADIEAHQTFRYDVAHDGRLIGKTLVADQGSDGVTLDEEGNLYLTGDGVTVRDSAGRQVEHIPVPDEKWTSASAKQTGGRSSSPPAPTCTACRCV